MLEGGAIDGDGSGTVVTTEQCLLNPNRNPGVTHEDIEGRLEHDLGFERVIWLGDGLLNDHTDGHVDNLARFVAPGPRGDPDGRRRTIPTRPSTGDAAKRLRDGRARRRHAALARPDRDEDGDIVPASYMNFYIGNAAVVVPQYGAPNDRAAVERRAGALPGSRCNRTARRPCADRRRKLPLHHPAGARMTKLTVAALQLAFGEDTVANIKAVADLVREAAAQGRGGRPAARAVRRPLFLPRRGRGPVRDCAADRRASVGGALQELGEELKIWIPTSFFERTGRIITTASP